MLSVLQLWLPVLASTLLVFIASSLVHMVFKWHNGDYRRLPDEEGVRAALNKSPLPPGQYLMPFALGMSELQSPELQAKYREGPNAMLLVSPKGVPGMLKQLGLWFALCLAISLGMALAAGGVLGPGARFVVVFHVVAIASFLAYGAGSITNGIWRACPWRNVAFDLLDAAIYALVTGLTFAWLWPSGV